MKVNYFFLFICFFLNQFTFAQISSELLIFIQEGKSISQNLILEDLPAIQEMAESQNISVKLIPLKGAAPEEIDFTPTLVFQNNLGRSIYKGRYKALDRLTNFVRTAQGEAQDLTDYSKNNILYFQNYQVVIGASIKITDLSGVLPKGFDQLEFRAKAQTAIIKGMSQLKFKQEANLPAQARLFYIDFYPYRSQENDLFINTRIYSMFSCVEPVFESEIAIKGNFGTFEILFSEASADLEKMILTQINNTKYGDGIEPLNENFEIISFEELGFPLPTFDLTNEPVFSQNIITTSQKWVFEKVISETSPVLQFQFPAPLNHYAGEAKKMEMQLELSEKETLANATGKIEVASKSITMGDVALDDHILNEYILADEFPIASYDFEITDAPENLKAGEVQTIKLKGIFQMKDIKVELPATGTVELIANEFGEARLKVHGQFDLKLRELFGIKGPDGPKKASDLLQFRLNFLMRPVNDFPAENVFQDLANDYSNEETEAVAELDEKGFGKEFGTINWMASTKVYKASGYFKNWNFTHLNIPNNDLEKIEATFEIDLNSIWEKSKLLVKHVKSDKFLEVEKYPIAQISIEGVSQQNDGKYLGEALVEMKGIKENVPFNFQVISESPLTIKGTCEIPRKTFKIGKVKRKGGVSKMVTVEMEVILDAPNLVNATDDRKY